MGKQSIATKPFIESLLNDLTKALSGPELRRNKDWTDAVWYFFSKFTSNGQSKSRKSDEWDFHPKSRSSGRGGEYLVDFILLENGYGPRIAVECEWQFWRKDALRSIDWAFDKLRGVKSDIKLLIHEWRVPPTAGGPDQKLRERIVQYISDYELISPNEAFVFLQYNGGAAYAYWWKPRRAGSHKKNEIKFELLKLSAK